MGERILISRTAIRDRSKPMKWTKPSYQILRLGFEINLYINNR